MTGSEGKSGPAQARGAGEEQREAEAEADQEDREDPGERGLKVEDGPAAVPEEHERAPPGETEAEGAQKRAPGPQKGGEAVGAMGGGARERGAAGGEATGEAHAGRGEMTGGAGGLRESARAEVREPPEAPTAGGGGATELRGAAPDALADPGERPPGDGDEGATARGDGLTDLVDRLLPVDARAKTPGELAQDDEAAAELEQEPAGVAAGGGLGGRTAPAIAVAGAERRPGGHAASVRRRGARSKNSTDAGCYARR